MRFWLPLSIDDDGNPLPLPPAPPIPHPVGDDIETNSFGDVDDDDDDGNLGPSLFTATFTDWSFRFVSIDFCWLFSSPPVIFPNNTELVDTADDVAVDADATADVFVVIVVTFNDEDAIGFVCGICDIDTFVADGAVIFEDDNNVDVLLSNDKIGFKILWLFDAVIVDDARSTVSKDFVAFYKEFFVLLNNQFV